MHYDQKPMKNRLFIAVPLFAVGVVMVIFMNMSTKNFNIVWRYFSFTNQALACIALWVAAAYLAKTGKNYWLSMVPAAFMTVVCTTYFLTANECVGPLITALTGNQNTTYAVGLTIGLVFMAVLVATFIPLIGIKGKNSIQEVVA
jgi:carbon starvation protein CstA